MIPSLPSDITRISCPLVKFCGDTSLAVFIADRFFRDSSMHYDIEFLDEAGSKKDNRLDNPEKDESERIMKSSWYYKHSHTQPAICIFCVSVDVNRLATDRTKWRESIVKQYKHAVNALAANRPAIMTVYVCPGNRVLLNQGAVTEDLLIREYCAE